MRIGQASKKRISTVLALAVSGLLAGTALADEDKANPNADFGQRTAAEARMKAESAQEAQSEVVEEASGKAREKNHKAERKSGKEQPKADKKAAKADKKAARADEKARKNAGKAHSKGTSGPPEDSDDRIDAAAKASADAHDDENETLDGVTTPE
jgi:hypothetical protein